MPCALAVLCDEDLTCGAAVLADCFVFHRAPRSALDGGRTSRGQNDRVDDVNYTVAGQNIDSSNVGGINHHAHVGGGDRNGCTVHRCSGVQSDDHI